MQDMGIKILFEGDHLIRLLEGMGVTLRISLVSAGGSVILGMIFGMLMMADHAVIRWVSRIYLEFVRIMPQLVLLFLAYFGAAIFQENRRPQRCLLSGERQKWGIWCAALCSLFPDIKGRAVRH